MNNDSNFAPTQEFCIPGLSNLPINKVSNLPINKEDPTSEDHTVSQSHENQSFNANELLNLTQPFNFATPAAPGSDFNRCSASFGEYLMNGTQCFNVSSSSCTSPAEMAAHDQEIDDEIASNLLIRNTQSFDIDHSFVANKNTIEADCNTIIAESDETQIFQAETDCATSNTSLDLLENCGVQAEIVKTVLTEDEQNADEIQSIGSLSSDDQLDNPSTTIITSNPASPQQSPPPPTDVPAIGQNDDEWDYVSPMAGLRRTASFSIPAQSATVIRSDDEGEEGGTQEEEGDVSREEPDEGEEADDKKSEVGELIADIFGESDDEATLTATGGDSGEHDNEEVSTSNNVVDNEDEEDNCLPEGADEVAGGPADDQDEDDDRPVMQHEEEFVSDFDLMMEKRRKQSQRWRRRKRDYEFISYNDDMIVELLDQMKMAAKEDIDLNSMQVPATRKRTLLPVVLRELRKADLVSGFIESGVVSALAQWLSPLPDKSLPALEIRTEFLKILQTFPTLDHQILRSSNIGKAVMLLFKHPKETKENKERAQRLINEWARPIFNLQTDYRSLTKDERTKRDYDHMPMAKKRRLSLENEKSGADNSKKKEEKSLGPGDKGFIGRARVPRPSTRDYVVRPKWNVETEFRKTGNKKQSATKIDKKIREIKMKTAPKKSLHAVGVSLEGRRMAV